MRGQVSILAVIALLPLALQDAASSSATAPTPAPPLPERHPVIRLLSQVPVLPAETEPGGAALLRRAQPAGDARDWLLPDDPVVQRFLAGTDSARAGVRLEVAADGTVSDCKPEAGAAEGYGPAICQALDGRATFLPALDQTGTRLPDAYILTANFQWIRVQPRRFVEYELTAARPPSLDAWPPPYGTPQMQATGLRLLPGGGGAPEAMNSPWAGARLKTVIADGAAYLGCEITASSGDAAFNQRACATAEEGTYRLPHPWASVLFVQAQGRPHAVLPVHRGPVAPTAGSDATAALATLPAEALSRLRLQLEIDDEGRPTHCTVRQSSGSDELDLAACRLTRENVRFVPGQDIFGRPLAMTLWSWSPAR